MPSRRVPHLLDGSSKLNNFLVGTIAGAFSCEVVGLVMVASSLPWQTLIYCLLGAPAIGLLVVLAGTDPNVKALAEEQNRRVESGERPLSVGETLEGIEAANPRLHRNVARVGMVGLALRLLRR
jgi:hypothetical protein